MHVTKIVCLISVCTIEHQLYFFTAIIMITNIATSALIDWNHKWKCASLRWHSKWSGQSLWVFTLCADAHSRSSQTEYQQVYRIHPFSRCFSLQKNPIINTLWTTGISAKSRSQIWWIMYHENGLKTESKISI